MKTILLILALSAVVAITVIAMFRALLYTSFDPVVAQASGIASPLYEYVLLVMLALTIVVALQAVGIVLVAALLVTPAAAAYQLTSRFAPMMAGMLFGGHDFADHAPYQHGCRRTEILSTMATTVASVGTWVGRNGKLASLPLHQ